MFYCISVPPNQHPVFVCEDVLNPAIPGYCVEFQESLCEARLQLNLIVEVSKSGPDRRLSV